MPEVHVDQFVPVLLPNDAVGNHTLETQRALVEAGVDSSIWAISVHHRLAGRGRPYGEFDRASRAQNGQRLLVYQAASVSGGIVDYLLTRPEPKSISYHNLTPPEFYEPFAPSVAGGLREAQAELRRLLPHVKVATAASEFNAADLRARGVPDVRVIPPFIGFGPRCEPDFEHLQRLRAAKTGLALLFVGRLVPNKTHQHLIRLVAALRAACDPGAVLYLVGPDGPDQYVHSLRTMAERLVPGGVVFTGPVSDGELQAHYEAADAFVCMSEHEGFGVPLVEAMRARLPIVAYDRGAVAETLGGSGILLRTPEPRWAAEVVARMGQDEILRDQLIRRQLARAKELEQFPRDRMIVEAALAVCQVG